MSEPNFKNQEKLTVNSSIGESYRFLTSHFPHFFRLIYGPLILLVWVNLIERMLLEKYNIHMNSLYARSFITAGFAIAWYQQYLLGESRTSYLSLLRKGFSGTQFSWSRFGRTLLRIIVISLALLLPTLILSIGMMAYYSSQGIIFSEDLIQELAMTSTFTVMLIFSPILVRMSLYTAGFALGRTSMNFKQVWNNTRGYTVTLWWVALRGFLPLSIYSYVITLLLRNLTDKLDMHYILSTILIEMIAGYLTFMMLAIVVAANAEAFRLLIGVRKRERNPQEDCSAD